MSDEKHTFLPQHGHYKNLRVYAVTQALYDLTYYFNQRYMPSHGDRTVDQMIQSARSGKQNIAEGNQVSATSSSTEILLTGVARGSLEELKADFEDYLRTRSLTQWDKTHPRLIKLRAWTRTDDFKQHYMQYAIKMNDEELANLCLTLCHQSIYMLNKLIDTQQDRFVTEGGIKERMYAARTGYRQAEMEELKRLREENQRLRALLKEHGIEG